MIKLEIENNLVIFLNHRDLINSSYTKEETKTEYELKVELFLFQPKESKQADEVEVVQKKKANRKRKLNKTQEELNTAEFKDQQDRITKILAHLKTEFPQKEVNSIQLFHRCWEEACTFPQFNGANSTNIFQSFRFDQHDFLIPPHCRFFNYNVQLLHQLLPQLEKYDLIVMDPPWRNKYIRRLKRARLECAYQMLDNGQLQQMPIGQLIHKQTLVAVWCTNSIQHQKALVDDFLPTWNLRLLHSLKWYKLNTEGGLIGPLNSAVDQKQPFEMLYIACHRESPEDFGESLKAVDMLLSIPSIVHSHKPPLLPWLRDHLPSSSPKCLEIFARYLQPEFTSVGLEVLKLMDKRLYSSCDS